MVASATTSPEYAASDRPCKVYFPLAETGANFVRVWITSAPPGSEQRAKLDESLQSRVPVFAGDGGLPWEVTFTTGGRYTFLAQEYQRGRAAYGGGYQYAPDSDPLETPLGAETTLTIDIGQRLTCPVGTVDDASTLVLWVWADTIRSTTAAQHGEVSPVLTATNPTPKVAAAMESTSVVAAVAALANEPVETAIGSISAIVSNLVTKHNAHTALAINVHVAGDTTNQLPVSYGSSMSPKDLPAFVNLALSYMRRHRANDDGEGIDSDDTHNPTGSLKKSDFLNSPIIDAVSGLPDAYAALAELYRCHMGHVAGIDGGGNEWHGSPSSAYDDADYELNALPKLLAVHLEVFEVFAAFSPTVPPTQTEGAMLLISQAGFTET